MAEEDEIPIPDPIPQRPPEPTPDRDPGHEIRTPERPIIAE